MECGGGGAILDAPAPGGGGAHGGEGGSSNPFVPKSNLGLESPKFDFWNPPELLPDKTLPPGSGAWLTPTQDQKRSAKD